MFPIQRPRRLRRTPAIRALVRETWLRPEDLVWPVFVHELDDPAPIPIPRREPFWNLPNTLTVLRIMVVPVFLFH